MSEALKIVLVGAALVGGAAILLGLAWAGIWLVKTLLTTQDNTKEILKKLDRDD